MAFGKKNKNKKNNDSNKNSSDELTLKEMRVTGRKPIAMSDIAWAGRLYSKFNTIFEDLTKAIIVMLVISAICLILIWGAVFMRTPALLLGVYPNGQVICYPKLITIDGRQASLHKSYQNMCNVLAEKASSGWQIENTNIESDDSAVGSINEKNEYKTVDEIIKERNLQEI